MTIDMMTIPTREAVLALDMVASHIMTSEEEGVALSNNSDFIRMSNLYRFHGIKGRFASMVLDAVKTEGKRQMFQRQPLHVRQMSTMDSSEFLSFDDLSDSP